MEVKATVKYLRISPRKVRLVLDAVRGLGVEAALTQLAFIKKAAARPVKKLVESAIANAENNFKLKRDNLYLAKIFANEGTALKRWLPRAFGRATPLLKRSSHITLVLAEKAPTASAMSAAKAKGGKKAELAVVAEKPKESLTTAADEGEEGKEKSEGRKGGRGFTQKLFNRKSG